jgi:hypothetical protein
VDALTVRAFSGLRTSRNPGTAAIDTRRPLSRSLAAATGRRRS